MEKTETNTKVSLKNKKIRWMRLLFILSFVIIPVVQFLLFYVYVNISSVFMAFQRPEKGQIIFVGLENFEWVIDRFIHGSENLSDDLGFALGNTLKTFCVQIIMFVVGLFVSYFIYKKILGYKAFRVIFYLPSIISGVVVSYFYTALMSSSSFFPDLLERLYKLDYDLASSLVDSDFANKMIMLNIIWLSFPANIILWGGSFSRIPESVIESGVLDGASWLREMFQIVLPMVWPTLVLLLTTNFAAIFGATGNVFLLTKGDYGTQTLSNWMYMRIYEATNPYATNTIYRVSALGLMLTIISCAIAIVCRKFLNSRVEEVQY